MYFLSNSFSLSVLEKIGCIYGILKLAFSFSGAWPKSVKKTHIPCCDTRYQRDQTSDKKVCIPGMCLVQFSAKQVLIGDFK